MLIWILLKGLISLGVMLPVAYSNLANSCVYIPKNIEFIQQNQVQIRFIVAKNVVVYTQNREKYCETLIELEPLFEVNMSRYNLSGLEVPAFSDVSERLFYITKGVALPAWYVPKDLVKLHNPENDKTVYVRSEVYKAFKELKEAASKYGYIVYINSGFRSFKTQRDLFETYLKHSKRAHSYSAVPGSSQHQTGLVIDIGATIVHNRIRYSKSKSPYSRRFYKWLHNNAYKYGFIQPYVSHTKQGDLAVHTGYIEEPWHLYYIGPELAREFMLSKMEFMDWIIYKLRQDDRQVKISFKDVKD